MQVEQARRLKQLEQENTRLRRAVAHVQAGLGVSERRAWASIAVATARLAPMRRAQSPASNPRSGQEEFTRPVQHRRSGAGNWHLG